MSDDVRGRPGVYRIPRSRGMDGPTRKLAYVAGGLGAALVVVVAVWASTGRHGSTTVPVIQADTRALRVKPDNAGGLQVAGTNDAILSGDGDGKADALAPPPEAPAPAALKQLQATAPREALTASPAVPVLPPTHPSVAVPAHVAPSSPAVGGPQVQLAALDSEALALAEWKKLAKKMPTLIGDRHPLVSKIDRSGKLLWRVRTDGFATIAQATQFCEQVKAKGAHCELAVF